MADIGNYDFGMNFRLSSNREDPAKRFASAAKSNADRAIADMVAAGQQGVNALSGLQTDSRLAIDAAGAAADTINIAGGNVRDAANRMNAPIANLGQDAAALRQGAGDTMALAQPWLTAGTDLLNMNRDAPGTAGEFWRLYGQLDPDLQMSLAAGDARAEAQAQTEAAVRSLTRAGVPPTAAAVASLESKMANYSAALVSAVKTKARQAGVNLQMEALGKGLQMAIASSGMGEQFLRDSVEQQKAAAQVESAVGDLIKGQGGLYATEGDLAAKGGALRLDAVNTGTNTAKALQSAYQALQASYATSAEYWSTQASSELGLLMSGVGVSGNNYTLV